MARSITKTGFEFVVKGAAGASADIKSIEKAAQKMDLAFAKSMATGTKFGPALTASLAGAIPNIGALQLGVVGLAASMADKLLPLAGQTASYFANSAVEAAGLKDELDSLIDVLDEYNLHIYKTTGIDLGLGRYEEMAKDRAKAEKEGLEAVAKWKQALDELDEDNAKDFHATKLARILALTEKNKAAEAKQREDQQKVARERQLDQIAWISMLDRQAREQKEKDAKTKQAALEAERAYQAQLLAENQRAIAESDKLVQASAATRAAAVDEEIKKRELLVGAFNVLMQATQDYTQAVVSGQKTAGEATADMAKQVLQSVINMILLEIQARAVSAAVKAFDGSMASATAVAGPAGIAIAAGAAAAAFSGAMAYTEKMPHLASGGYVMGGVPGRDSVPAVLQPGEFVIPARETALMQSMMGRSMGGKGTTIVINQMVPDSQATTRMVRDQLIPAQRRLQRLGAR